MKKLLLLIAPILVLIFAVSCSKNVMIVVTLMSL